MTTTPSSPAPTVEDDLSAALTHLHWLTIGGEFSHWIETEQPVIAWAACKEFDQARVFCKEANKRSHTRLASPPSQAPAEPLSDERIDQIALKVTYGGDTSIPYRQDWCEETGRPFARAIEAEVRATQATAASTGSEAAVRGSIASELAELITLEGFGCACEPNTQCRTCAARSVLHKVLTPYIATLRAATTQGAAK